MVKGREGERVRLYVRGTVLGYKRSKSNQYPSTSLVQIEGVNTKEEVNWYMWKRIAYIYKAKVKQNGSHYGTTAAFGERSVVLMEITALFEPSSRPTSPLNMAAALGTKSYSSQYKLDNQWKSSFQKEMDWQELCRFSSQQKKGPTPEVEDIICNYCSILKPHDEV